MPDFTAVDPDVLDDVAAYGAEPIETPDERSERLARAFESGATLRLDVPPADEAPGGAPGEAPRRRRGRQPGASPRRTVAGGQIGTLFVAGATILIGFTIGEWAQPNAAEANAIAVPLGNILARRIDLASKLGKDTDDVVTLAIAIMAWMSRVGPIAAGRVRANVDERTRRRNAARVDGPPEPVRGTNAGRSAGVAPGNDGVQGSGDGPPYTPVNVVAEAARRGLGYLDRDLGPNP